MKLEVRKAIAEVVIAELSGRGFRFRPGAEREIALSCDDSADTVELRHAMKAAVRRGLIPGTALHV